MDIKRPKPRGLGLEYARQFQDETVADAYACRPPYPAGLFDALCELIPGGVPGKLLDIGCGRGEIAREMVLRIGEVDAVDFSSVMIERGKQLPGGDHAGLRWICSSVEAAQIVGPYVLITAGSSLHWMDWGIVMPKLVRLLAPGAVLAIFDDNTMPAPWDAEVNEIIPDYSTNKDFEPYHLIEELARRGHFKLLGQKKIAPEPFAQTLEQYIEAFHSRNGFSRQRMTAQLADEFDEHLAHILRPYAHNGRLHLSVVTRIAYGLPQN